MTSSARDDLSIVELIPALRAFARTFCRQQTDADDLVQETLVRALNGYETFSPGTRLKSWLFTIMRNTFYTKVKIAKREAPGVADCVATRPSVDATQEWRVRGQEMAAALNRLPQHHREVLMLVGVLGVSYEETAAICGCAVGTVKSRLNRARICILREMGEASPQTLLEAGDKRAHSHYEADVRRH